MAPQVDALFFFILGVTVFFTVLIAGLVIYFAMKYRRRSADEFPAADRGSMKLEIAWTVVPLVLAMVMFVWGVEHVLRAWPRRPTTRWTSTSSASSGCGSSSIPAASARSTSCTSRSASR